MDWLPLSTQYESLEMIRMRAIQLAALNASDEDSTAIMQLIFDVATAYLDYALAMDNPIRFERYIKVLRLRFENRCRECEAHPAVQRFDAEFMNAESKIAVTQSTVQFAQMMATHQFHLEKGEAWGLEAVNNLYNSLEYFLIRPEYVGVNAVPNGSGGN